MLEFGAQTVVLGSKVFVFSLDVAHLATIVTLEHFLLIQSRLELTLNVGELNFEIFALINLLKQAANLGLKHLHRLRRVEGLLGHESLTSACDFLKSSLELFEAGVTEAESLLELFDLLLEFLMLSLIDQKWT